MMCYKDRTFCSRYLNNECTNHHCYRAFTEIDREEANQWWDSEDFPLCVGDCWHVDCGEIRNG